MDVHDAKKKILAAQALLLEPSGSFDKFHSIKDLLMGIHPNLDSALKRCEQDLKPIEHILGRDFFGFAAENMPEATEEQRERKKAVMLFWRTWNGLRGEVSRVQAELEHAQNSPGTSSQVSAWGRVFNFAKGPFGILTIVAVGLVGASAYTSVDIVIKNQGCQTMTPSGSMPIPIPGISFPKEPIPNGASAKASLPGIPVTIDGTGKGSLVLSSIKISMTFELGSVDDVTFDGISLIGKKTDISLSSKKSHELVFVCK